MRRVVWTVLAALAGCSGDAGGSLTAPPPPPPPEPTCPSGHAPRAVTLGHNPGFAAARASLDRGRVPTLLDVTPNYAFGERELAHEGVCCDGVICVDAGLAVVPGLATRGPRAVLEVSILADAEPAEVFATPPARTFVVAVDGSASLLSRQRIDAVKAGLHSLVDALEDDAWLGLVVFDSTARIVVPVGAVAGLRDDAHDAVDALRAGGGTDLWTGVYASYWEASRVFDPSREHRVIVITDGNDTRGDRDIDTYVRESLPFYERGIQLVVLGVGEPREQAWLEPLIHSADGRLVLDPEGQNLPAVIGEELDRRYMPLARDVEIQVEPASTAGFGPVFGWSPAPRQSGVIALSVESILMDADGRHVTLGQPAAGGPALVADLALIPSADRPNRIHVFVQYSAFGESARRTARVWVDVPDGWTDTITPITPHAAAREALLARHLGEALRESAVLWSQSRRADAVRTLLQVEALLADFPDADDDVDRDRTFIERVRTRMAADVSDVTPPPIPEDPWPDP